MLPGLENYVDEEGLKYALLVLGPQYPHRCTSFDYPARYAVDIRGDAEKSLLFVVLRGRDRVDDISWRVYVNEVKVSRVFKPQHLLPLREGAYYVYVADTSPITRGIKTAEVVIKCHAPATQIESTGVVLLLPEEFKSRVGVHIGISRIENTYELQVPTQGFTVISMAGRGEGGAIAVGGSLRRFSVPFEHSEILTSGSVSIRGPLNFYTVVTNSYTGKPPEVVLSTYALDAGKVKLAVSNSGDYCIKNVEVKLLRGTQTISKLTIKSIKPREESTVVLDREPGAVVAKVTYEFLGHFFTKTIPIEPTEKPPALHDSGFPK
ncbi:MAG: hypothetical protein RMH84_02555 [Sulfolobales archaeon]|nr:hypothetical protein [Sulfolobales archaeon]MCX8208771.1 hypothetical protein [Sulfolobales archaeon]MDW8010457.1 hypothetical protein [Sulfolobales archaeon]